jgi:hypothetical protein
MVMKKISMLILIIFLLINCRKTEEVKNNNCLSLTTITGWEKIDFKTDYTIQVPVEFKGDGLQGFEGNSFYKSSADDKIKLSSGYSNSLFTFDFGDTLQNPAPKSIQVMNNFSKLITLDKTEIFCQNSETIGVFYYSNIDISRGRLYWKDTNPYRQALEVDFYLSQLETVNKIIETIKRR